MHFQSNTFTLLALAVGLVCVLQLVPSADAQCTPAELRKQGPEICSGSKHIPIFGTLCKGVVEKVILAFEAICKKASSSSSESTTPAWSSSSTTVAA